MDKEPITFAAFIGLDWADKKHDICLLEVGHTKFERSVLEHKPAVIQEWAEAVRKRFGGKPVALGIELSRGPIVSALLEFDFFVLFPINPATLAKYRQAFAPSRAKDDPTDAQIMVEMMQKHPEKLSPYKQESKEIRILRRLVEERRGLVNDRVRITNRITYALKAYFPQVLGWFRDKYTEVFMAFLERFPTLELAQKAKDKTLADFFHAHNVRYSATVKKRIAAIREERPLSNDIAAIVPAKLTVELLLAQLQSVCAGIARFDDEIEKLCAKMTDYKLFRDLPGAGATLSPRLLVAFGQDRDRFETAASVQMYAGIAPVTERSGNKHWVHWRFICSRFVRQTFVEWAGQTVPVCFWAKAFYEQQRAKGSRHQAALRALAFKWIRILFRCWKDRLPYDESRYLMALQKRQSPLLKFAAANPS